MRVENNEGFTLLEVLVAVVLAAVGFAGLYSLSTQCMKQVWAARDTSRAVSVGEYEMERFRTLPWSTVEGYQGSYTILSNNNPALALLPSGGSGKVLLTGSGDERQVTVVVSYGSVKSNVVASGLIVKDGFLR